MDTARKNLFAERDRAWGHMGDGFLVLEDWSLRFWISGLIVLPLPLPDMPDN